MPSKPSSFPRNRLSEIGGSADIPLVNVQTHEPQKAFWSSGDPVFLRVGKLAHELRRSHSRRELIEKLVQAVQTIERSRVSGTITDDSAATYTELLVNLAAIQPAFEETSSTVERYLFKHFSSFGNLWGVLR